MRTYGCRLYVGNIDFRMNKEDIKEFFTSSGKVVDIFFPRPKSNKRTPHRGFIFVEMQTYEQALCAVKLFHGKEDTYGRELIVRVADLRDENKKR